MSGIRETIARWLLGPAKPEASAWTDPAWWGGLGDTTAGISVGPDTALKISTVYACVGLISETIATLPMVIYRWLENEDGRERARNHPLYRMLHDQPNDNQTAFEFVQMMQAHALLRGSGYSRIQAGPRGFADQLIPLHPDQVQKEKMTRNRFRYVVTDENGRNPVNAEDIFEVGGLSLDGLNTVSVITYARDSFGLGLAAERYGSRLFRNDSRPGGILTTDKTIKPETANKLKAQWESMHTGGSQHRVAVLTDGLTWQQVGISPEEAQFLGTREFQAEDVCRWFRVPPHMVGLTSKATSWGSGIEEMTIGFLTYTLQPWLTRWRQAVRRDLILASDTYFMDFIVDALLKGDIAGRYNAYAIGRQWGWLSRNDIRRFENMNPIPGGDDYLTPLNMTDVANAEELAPPVMATAEPVAANGHYRLLAEEAAGRLVRKERAAITRMLDRAEGEEAIREFYAGHVGLVAQTLRMSVQVAQNYCDDQVTAVLSTGDWPDIDQEMIGLLADLAIEQ
jgi:HK97 family phage portal protein